MTVIGLVAISLASLASRPVNSSINRNDLINQSQLIFSGWPSQQKSLAQCSEELGRWQVHKVIKGSKSLEGKIISIAPYRFEIKREIQKKVKSISYASEVYKNGTINFEAKTSIIFATKTSQDSCFELSAEGAQEDASEEAFLVASQSNDCSEINYGLTILENRIPKNCQIPEDCQVIEYYLDRCDPFILANRSIPAEVDAPVSELRNRLKAVCAKEVKGAQSCYMSRPSEFVCEKGFCKKGLTKEKISKLPKMTEGEISNACAPHDALSVLIHLKPQQGQYPRLSLNYWGSERSSLLAGSSRKLKFLGQDNFNNYSSTFCLAPSVCSSLKSIELDIHFSNKNEGSIQFKIMTAEGDAFEGSAPFKLSSKNQICG